jgi:hypothetical protein
MNLAGLAILVVGLIVYGGVWAAATGSSGAAISLWDVVFDLVGWVGIMIVDEGIDGVAIAAFGGKPEFGATMVGKALPAFYCTSVGTRFSRVQFVTIALAPAIVLGVGTAIAIAALPAGGWLVVPAAIHIGGCVGDFAMTIVAARLPAESLVEDMKSGMRIYIPDTVTPQSAP